MTKGFSPAACPLPCQYGILLNPNTGPMTKQPPLEIVALRLKRTMAYTVSTKLYIGLLFTKQTDTLPQNITKSRSRKIRVYTFQIALKVDRHIDSSAVEMRVKFQSWRD